MTKLPRPPPPPPSSEKNKNKTPSQTTPTSSSVPPPPSNLTIFLNSPIILITRLLSFIIIDILLIVVFSPLGIIYELFFSFINSAKLNNKSKIIIVLIHGTGISSIQWLVIKLYLYISSINFVVVDYNYNQRINKSCIDCIKQIDDLNVDKRDVILIGHSQGGLIARNIHYKVNSKATFLINTPQKGASILGWLYPYGSEGNINPKDESLLDMKVDSCFINELPKTNSTFYEIVSCNDFVRSYECICQNTNVYYGFFGHYFNAVNPFLWFYFIVPAIGKVGRTSDEKEKGGSKENSKEEEVDYVKE